VSESEVAIIGAGPAGLMAAETIAGAGVRVTVYDRMPSVARKFLMAGRGGLNLTHSEALDLFLARYGAARPRLRAAMEAFPPQALRAWSEALGQPTFVGSSGRVFPQAFKASPLLRAWLRRLDARGVRFALRHNWTGWDASGALRFATPEGERSVRPDATLLALGGASWPRLGADGTWTSLLVDKGVAIAPLKPANCGFLVGWSEIFRSRFEGQPLKGVQLRHGECSVRGEAVVTRHGLEGGGIYALSASLRDAIAANGETILQIGLRPDLPAAELVTRLSSPRGKQSVSTFLRKAVGLSPVGIGLLQEAAARMGTPLGAMTADTLAVLIGGVPVVLTGPASIDRAISTAGGLVFDEIDDRFMLRRWPGVFVAGEMMDWEAPTGGYLLQACFATGVAAGKGVLEFLQR
jgi:uncharacterized flavoprotein (TIGR03862 family)